MSTLTEQRQVAIAAYRDCLDKFVGAYAQLAALDLALRAQGFGPPPEIVPLRHADAAPNFSADIHAEIRERFAALKR